MYLVLSAIVVVVFVGTSKAKVCTSDAECGSGQCCITRLQFTDFGKKRQITIPSFRTGDCVAYQTEGDSCSPLGKVMGKCGCGPGLSCKEGTWTYAYTTSQEPIFVDATAQPPGQRIPGNYYCVKEPIASGK